MIKLLWSLTLWLPVVACGGSVEPVLFRGPVRAESMACAEERLRAADYDVFEAGETLEGELTIMSGGVATRRELIRVSLAAPDELQARVTAQLLEAPERPTESRPLVPIPTEPLPSTLTAAEALVEACGG